MGWTGPCRDGVRNEGHWRPARKTSRLSGWRVCFGGFALESLATVAVRGPKIGRETGCSQHNSASMAVSRAWFAPLSCRLSALRVVAYGKGNLRPGGFGRLCDEDWNFGNSSIRTANYRMGRRECLPPFRPTTQLVIATLRPWMFVLVHLFVTQ